MNEIKCPHDLNQFLLGEPIFENTFSEEECEHRKFYGDCYHCFSTAIAKRDQQLKNTINKIRAEIEELWKNEPCPVEYGCLDEILQVIDKYKSEGSE